MEWIDRNKFSKNAIKLNTRIIIYAKKIFLKL